MIAKDVRLRELKVVLLYRTENEKLYILRDKIQLYNFETMFPVAGFRLSYFSYKELLKPAKLLYSLFAGL